MSRIGVILLAVGVAVAVLGTAQFELVLALSNDPNPNPAVNGVLMWFSWAAGGILAVIGLVMAIAGRSTHPHHLP